MERQKRDEEIIKRREEGAPYSQIGREFCLSGARCQQIYGSRNQQYRPPHKKFIMFDGKKKFLMTQPRR